MPTCQRSGQSSTPPPRNQRSAKPLGRLARPARRPGFLGFPRLAFPGTPKPPPAGPITDQPRGHHIGTFLRAQRVPQSRRRSSRETGRGATRDGRTAGTGQTGSERGKRHATMPGGASSLDGSHPFGLRTTRIGSASTTAARKRRTAPATSERCGAPSRRPQESWRIARHPSLSSTRSMHRPR